MSLIDAIGAREWAIQPQMLRTILEVANREKSEFIEALQKQQDERLDNTHLATIRNDVAVIPVIGPIFKYANLFTRISGAVSLELLSQDFQAALEHPDVKHIILHIDSPGGEANGVNEFAKAVYAAREEKNIVAYVSGLGGSGAYWIAAAASQVIADDAAFLGSIGVVTTLVDDRERLEKTGVKEIEIISSSSPHKRPDPASENGRAVLQARVDALQTVFVSAVARYREVSEARVLTDFGRGDVLIGQAAVAAGMADGIGSLEGIIETLTTKEHIHMAETKGQQYRAEDITAELIAEAFPQVAEQFKAEGQRAERIRIMGIHALQRPGLEGLITEAMFNSDSEAGAVALQIIEREKHQRGAAAQLLAEDAAEVPALAAAAPSEDPETALQQSVDAAVVKGLNTRQNSIVT